MSALLKRRSRAGGTAVQSGPRRGEHETNDQVLGTSVVEITGVRRGERPAKFACPVAGIVDAGRLRSKGGRTGITDPGYNNDPSHPKENTTCGEAVG